MGWGGILMSSTQRRTAGTKRLTSSAAAILTHGISQLPLASVSLRLHYHTYYTETHPFVLTRYLLGQRASSYVEFKGSTSNDWALTQYEFDGYAENSIAIEIGINGDDKDVYNEKFYLMPKNIIIDGVNMGDEIITNFLHDGTAYITVSFDNETMEFSASFTEPTTLPTVADTDFNSNCE